MKVKVRFFAAYREAVGQRELETSLPQGATPQTLLEELMQQYPSLRGTVRSPMVAINAEYATLDSSLKEGDEVVFIPPVSGGVA